MESFAGVGACRARRLLLQIGVEALSEKICTTRRRLDGSCQCGRILLNTAIFGLRGSWDRQRVETQPIRHSISTTETYRAMGSTDAPGHARGVRVRDSFGRGERTGGGEDPLPSFLGIVVV